jgi:hypothetical protein
LTALAEILQTNSVEWFDSQKSYLLYANLNFNFKFVKTPYKQALTA